jgi:single-strand DNA-binding protein
MNKVILKGRISQDLDIRYTQTNNTMVAKFGVAVRNDFKSANGEYETQFFNCTAFGKTAEHLKNYFKKGQEILLTGRLQNSSWETDSGEKRYRTDVIVETTEFCGSKANTESTPTDIPQEVNVVENDIGDDLPF